MEVRDLSLYYFTLVAKSLNISATAKSLFISQQALSKHIMRLESDFGVTLFERGPRLRLTQDGEYIFVYAEHVLAKERALRKSLKEARPYQQRIPVGLVTDSADILIAPLISKYETIRPYGRLSFINCTYANTIDLMRQGRITASFGMLHAFSDIFTKIPIFPDDLFFIVKKDSFEKMNEHSQEVFKRNVDTGITLADICQSGLPLIIPWSGSRIGSYLMNEFHRMNENPSVLAETWYFDELFPICDLKYSGAVAHSAQVYNHLSQCLQEQFYIFPIKNLDECYVLGMVYHEDLANGPDIATFLDCIQDIKKELTKTKNDALKQYVENQFNR